MFRSKTHKHLNVQRHHDAGHMMRVAAFTVISCLIASSCSIIHTTAKHAPVVTTSTLDDTVPMVSSSRTDDTVLVGVSHGQAVADHPSPSSVAEHNAIHEAPTDAPAAETATPDPLATTVLAPSTAKTEAVKAESTKSKSAQTSTSKASSSKRSKTSSSKRSHSSHSKQHRTKKHKESHASSHKHGKEKHTTPKHEKHHSHDKAHKKSKSSSMRGRTASKPSESKKDHKSSKHSKHHKSSNHSKHSSSSKHDKDVKDSKDTKSSKDTNDNAAPSTDKAPSTTSAPADAPIIVPEAAIADADPDADTTGLSEGGTTDPLSDSSSESAATEPRNLNTSTQEKQQKLDKMLTTTTYIAIIAFLLALLLYFRHAMREIKKTQRLANEARAIAKDAQNIAEQQSSSPAAASGPGGAPIVDRRATDALKQAQERTQQKVDQLQNVLTDVRASLGGLIRQTTGHEETLSQLKNDMGDTKQQVVEAKQQVVEAKQQVNEAKQQVNDTQQQMHDAQQQIIDNTRQTDATKERLDVTTQSLIAATQKIDAINEELAKFKEEIAECQTAISKLNSTQRPSKKTASPIVLEQDLFAENSHEIHQAPLSSEISPSQATTEVAVGPTVNSAEENLTTTVAATAAAITPAAHAAAPAVAAAPAHAASAAIDVAKAKEAPVDYAESLAALYPTFFKNMAEHGAALTKRDRALSTLIALGVEREHLQDIFGLTRESLKAARYRIRTKLQLERRDNLDDYLKHWL